jgi:hypothetical protein
MSLRIRQGIFATMRVSSVRQSLSFSRRLSSDWAGLSPMLNAKPDVMFVLDLQERCEALAKELLAVDGRLQSCMDVAALRKAGSCRMHPIISWIQQHVACCRNVLRLPCLQHASSVHARRQLN